MVLALLEAEVTAAVDSSAILAAKFACSACNSLNLPNVESSSLSVCRGALSSSSDYLFALAFLLAARPLSLDDLPMVD